MDFFSFVLVGLELKGKCEHPRQSAFKIYCKGKLNQPSCFQTSHQTISVARCAAAM